MKSKYTAAALAFFLGGLGAHKFYLGKTGKGILYLVFVWTYIPAILGLIEAITYLTADEYEFNAKYGKQGPSIPSYTAEPVRYHVDEQPQVPPTPQVQIPKQNSTPPTSGSSFASARKKMASATKTNE
ncbi:MAG: NINE protein [Bacteroidales bacterium]|nr:NINE protein [Bacteroidales bacterium]